jgi:hypothetical protein
MTGSYGKTHQIGFATSGACSLFWAGASMLLSNAKSKQSSAVWLIAGLFRFGGD